MLDPVRVLVQIGTTLDLPSSRDHIIRLKSSLAVCCFVNCLSMSISMVMSKQPGRKEANAGKCHVIVGVE